ncbi:putative Serine/threonine-protein kinase [Podospora fimiseda]|uniref:non-specific serine/threonine protein kinase n=1 Tax=Podospora fimiseda TaxID=252190 RepID=A0AAN7BN67_9PEZI|nr:putative Serine/threonine-protein kinase [Podospora fimiseda]
MEPQPPQPPQHQQHQANAHAHAHQRPSHPQLHNIYAPPPVHIPLRTANSTPVSSPGFFSPTVSRPNMSLPGSQPGSESTTPGGLNSPYLGPLQSHKVRETHKANVEHDFATGRKLINSYEIIEELGRGVHGKVKLARNLETGEFVAIKIIPRFSKKRRLGKVTAMSTQDKSKKEIAILKKIRHPNVVALLEIIDDPELKKIYMVLEHVELGEVVWRKKGLPHICAYERRRIEREQRGEKPSPEEERYEQLLSRRQAMKDEKRAREPSQPQTSAADFWSLELGNADEDEVEFRNRALGGDEAGAYTYSPSSSVAASRGTSRAPSRTQSTKSLSGGGIATPLPTEADFGAVVSEEDLETPGPLRDGMMYGAYPEDPALRGRSPSMAESIISHMSSVDYNKVHDPYVDDYSYVPCFTMDQARQTFRDTVLGLEYLHYEGVVHRDIKPANLLWTRDHRVKISDFGVSYFGRPVRDGEPDETISESEARDFDNDLELAKTVGTPAFFAPELCYTDAFDNAPQPKVTEQIDVWSLGVTLYCLIYARIPFLAEDEWQMFRKIATEEVYIPKRRLRPVDPATRPLEESLYTRINRDPYRDDDELSYEDIDRELQDLLSKMLTKNPEKRIRLRDVKRHPWVLHGIGNIIQWLEETDPSRRTSGRKIQVDDREVAHAVVPLTFLERARSAVKKTFNKVLHHRQERAESVSSRRRAGSSAASSAGDIPAPNGLFTPHLRESRRKSIRPDDYFASGSQQQQSEHPLTHSVLASPRDESPEGPKHQQQQQSSTSTITQPKQLLELVTNLTSSREDFWQTASASPYKSLPRSAYGHGPSRSVTNAFLPLTPRPSEARTMPTTPFFDSANEDPCSALRKARDMRPLTDDLGRARSVDRGLFASNDKRAEAKVSLSTAVAPGNIQHPQRPFASRVVEMTRGLELAASPIMTGYQHTNFKSDPSIYKQRMPVELDDRPLTAHRIEDHPEAKTPQQRPRRPSLYDPSPRTQVVDRPRRQPTDVTFEAEPALVRCPPSPEDDDSFHPPPISRGETIATAKSSSSTSIGALTTPLTSPSEAASPVIGINTNLAKDATERMLAFQSDPSLPALLSSTSSVSADFEGEFLGSPGVVGRSSVIDTTDTITPPAFAKESMSGFPLCDEQGRGDLVSLRLDERARPASAIGALRGRKVSRNHDEDNDDDSDSDDGLVIMSKKKKLPLRDTHSAGRLAVHPRRRDTNASIGSTETAKKIVVDSE